MFKSNNELATVPTIPHEFYDWESFENKYPEFPKLSDIRERLADYSSYTNSQAMMEDADNLKFMENEAPISWLLKHNQKYAEELIMTHLIKVSDNSDFLQFIFKQTNRSMLTTILKTNSQTILQKIGLEKIKIELAKSPTYYHDASNEVLLTLFCENNCYKNIIWLAENDPHFKERKILIWEGEYLKEETPLIFSIKKEYHETVKTLLACGVDITTPDEKGFTPLHYAADSKNNIIIDYLWEYAKDNNINLDINALTVEDRKNVLHIACIKENIVLIKKLLTKNPNINQYDIHKRTPVHYACSTGNNEIINLLFDYAHANNIDINLEAEGKKRLFHFACETGNIELFKKLTPLISTEFMRCDSKNYTPLHYACTSGNNEIINLLFDYAHANNIDINQETEDKKTFLHIACETGNLELVQKLAPLITTDFMRFDSKNFTPLHYACKTMKNEIIDLLFTHAKTEDIYNLVTNPNVKFPILHFACFTSNTHLVKKILELQVPIEIYDKNGFSPLHYTSITKNKDITDLLFTHAKNEELVNLTVNQNIKYPLLHNACYWGDTHLVKKLLDFQVPTNVYNVSGYTPIHYAILRDHDDVIDLLLTHAKEKGIDINQKTTNQKTLLHLACETGNLELVQKLLIETKQINDCDNRGFTPLHIACFKNRNDVINLILKHDNSKINQVTKEQQTLLHIACETGNLELIKNLLTTTDQVNAHDNRGFTPLHIACFKNRNDAINLILAHDNNKINQVTKQQQQTLLHIACETGNNELIQKLLIETKQINDYDNRGYTPLHIACYLQNNAIIDLIIEHNNDNVNQVTKEKQTLLHIACQTGNTELVVKLLRDTKQIDKYNDRGFTPLHSTCLIKRNDIINLILAHNNDNINQLTEKESWTLLHIACDTENIELIKNLLTTTNQANAYDNQGYTPLHTACFRKNNAIINLILEQNAENINQLTENKNWTLSHLACQTGNTELIKKLLTTTNQINAYSKDGYTPLHVAYFMKNNAIIALILEHNPNAINQLTEKENWTLLHIACDTENIELIKNLLTTTNQSNAYDNHGYTPLHIASFKKNNAIIALILEHNPNAINQLTKKEKSTLLHIACDRENIELIKNLLTTTNQVNAYDNHGYTPLHIACFRKNNAIIELILEHNPNAINQLTEKENRTLLHLACQTENNYLVTKLLELGSDINVYDKYGNSPFHIVCYKKNQQLNTILWPYLNKNNINQKNQLTGETFLQLACENNDDDLVEKLLALGANFNEPDNEGLTPLQIIAVNNMEKINKLILPYLTKDNINDKTSDTGETILHLACDKNNTTLAKSLLELGSDITENDNYHWTPVHTVCKTNNQELNKLFAPYLATLSKDKLNQRILKETGNVRETPLDIACYYGNFDFLFTLLENGADINQTVCHGYAIVDKMCKMDNDESLTLIDKLSPYCKPATFNQIVTPSSVDDAEDFKDYIEPLLYIPYRKNQCNLAEKLFALGTDIKQSNNDGYTALHYILEKNETPTPEQQTLQTLYLSKINETNVNQTTNNNDTYLHFACQNNNKSVVMTLLTKGSDLLARNNQGNTSLHLACSDGHEDIVTILLNTPHGNELLKIKNENGKTALELAQDGQHFKTAQLLIDHLKHDFGIEKLEKMNVNQEKKAPTNTEMDWESFDKDVNIPKTIAAPSTSTFDEIRLEANSATTSKHETQTSEPSVAKRLKLDTEPEPQQKNKIFPRP